MNEECHIAYGIEGRNERLGAKLDPAAATLSSFAMLKEQMSTSVHLSDASKCSEGGLST